MNELNEEKVGLTTKNWVLSIVGILVLSCFIILPPVFRVVFKEEVVDKPTDTNVPTLVTTCTKDNLDTTDYVDKEVITFEHKDSKIKSIDKKITRVYKDPLVYQEKKQSYGVLVTAFSIVAGYDYSATPVDDSSTINILEVYDLSTFVPTMIVVPGDTEPTAINALYELDTLISTAKDELTANGYTCSENN